MSLLLTMEQIPHIRMFPLMTLSKYMLAGTCPKKVINQNVGIQKIRKKIGRKILLCPLFVSWKGNNSSIIIQLCN